MTTEGVGKDGSDAMPAIGSWWRNSRNGKLYQVVVESWAPET